MSSLRDIGGHFFAKWVNKVGFLTAAGNRSSYYIFMGPIKEMDKADREVFRNGRNEVKNLFAWGKLARCNNKVVRSWSGV